MFQEKYNGTSRLTKIEETQERKLREIPYDNWSLLWQVIKRTKQIKEGYELHQSPTAKCNKKGQEICYAITE